MTPAKPETTQQKEVWDQLMKFQQNREPQAEGGDWFFFCPIHPDGEKIGKRSLSIQFPPSGFTKAHCFSCCQRMGKEAYWDRLASALEVDRKNFSATKKGQSQATYTPPKPVDPSPTKKRILGGEKIPYKDQELEASYVYKDQKGNNALLVHRYRHKVTKKKAGFPKDYWDGRQWVKARLWPGDVVKPIPTLYNIERVREARDRGEPIYIVEGEKTAEILIQRGLVATTKEGGGSSSWKSLYTQELRGSKWVIILPDNDQVGYSYSHQVETCLKNHVSNLKVLPLEGLEEKEDIAEWVEKYGHDPHTLFSLAFNREWDDSLLKTQEEKEAPLPEEPLPEDSPPPQEKKPRTSSVFDSRYSIKSLMEMPDKGWYLENLLASDELVMIAGQHGAGKTFIALDMAISLSLGRDWARHFEFQAPKTLKVDYFLGEGVSRANRRLRSLLEAQGVPEDDPLLDNFHLYGRLPFLSERDSVNSVDDIVSGYKERNIPIPDVIFIDTFARASAGVDENSAKDASKVISSLDHLRESLGCTVVVVHHTGKNGDIRGSSAYLGAFDGVLKVTKDGVGGGIIQAEKLKDSEDFGELSYSLLPLGESLYVGWSSALGLPRARVEENPVLDLLEENKGKKYTLKDIYEFFGGDKSQQMIRLALQKLEKAKRIKSETLEGSRTKAYWIEEMKPGAIRIDFSQG